MGYEQKAIICLNEVGVCASVATGLSKADPLNLATIPGRVIGEAVGETVEKMSA
jgi:hypothetical protein